MWCLSRYLPLIIGEHIPLGFAHWECLLLFLMITDYVFAPVFCHNDMAYIKELIREHHEMFCVIYPDSSFIHKLHYIIHTPEWLLRYVLLFVSNE